MSGIKDTLKDKGKKRLQDLIRGGAPTNKPESYASAYARLMWYCVKKILQAAPFLCKDA